MNIATLSVVLLATAAAAATAQETSPIVQMARGASDSFGPGFLDLSADRVAFRLSRPGNVILLWVDSNGEVDLYYPQRSRDRNARKAGVHTLRTGDLASPIETPTIRGAPSSPRPGQFAPAAPGGTLAGSRASDAVETAGYWVLIVGDEPTTAAEVKTRLLPMSREGGAEAVLERLAPLLVEYRTRLWAAYFAPVAK